MANTDAMEAVVRETFDDLRLKSEGFTRPCTIALGEAARLLLGQRKYKEMLGAMIRDELLKRYQGNRARERLEQEQPDLFVERGNPPTLTFKINPSAATPVGAPAAEQLPRTRKGARGKSRR